MFTFLGNWWFSLTRFQLGTNKVSMLFYFRYKTVLEFGDTSDTKFHDNVRVHFSALIPSPVSYPYLGIISFWKRSLNHDFWGNMPLCHCLSTQPSDAPYTTWSRNLLTLTSFSIFAVQKRQRSYEMNCPNFLVFLSTMQDKNSNGVFNNILHICKDNKCQACSSNSLLTLFILWGFP